MEPDKNPASFNKSTKHVARHILRFCGVLLCDFAASMAISSQCFRHTVAGDFRNFSIGLAMFAGGWSSRVLKPHEVAMLALLEVLFGITWAWWGAYEAPFA